MAKISRMKPGQILFDVQRQKMGNTTISYGVLFQVRIVDIDPNGEWVDASWNCNPVRRYSQKSCDRWKVKRPEPKRKIMGTDSYL